MYDPFKYADNFESEEEYFMELLKESEERNDKKRSNANSCGIEKKEY